MSYCPLWEKHVYTGSLNIGCSHHVQNIMFSFFLHQLQLCWMKYYTRNTIQRTFGVLQSSLNHKVVFCLPTLLFQIKLLRTKMFWAWWLYLGLRETGPTLDNCITLDRLNKKGNIRWYQILINELCQSAGYWEVSTYIYFLTILIFHY